MNKIIFLLCLFHTCLSYCQNIQIGLFPEKDIRSLVFSVVKGNYTVISDESIIREIHSGEIFFVNAEGNSLVVSDSINEIGRFDKLLIKGIENENIFQLKLISPLSLSYDYDDDLILSVKVSDINVINKVDIEKYIAGVIEAEGGSNAGSEYYKAQSVLARTYLYRNMVRHGADGFNLCNAEHCQAYKGKSMLNHQIYDDVKSTSMLVLTDLENNLIFAPYHSNCGGITGTADLVWQNHMHCLQSVNDPFCLESRNSSWEKTILLDDWKKYLEKNSAGNEIEKKVVYTFVNENRKKSFSLENSEISLKKIREDFSLKSSFFSISCDGEIIKFKGRGYGHGVGMCQEGAIEMAKVGYTYIDIIHFYFQDVLIQPYKK